MGKSCVECWRCPHLACAHVQVDHSHPLSWDQALQTGQLATLEEMVLWGDKFDQNTQAVFRREPGAVPTFWLMHDNLIMLVMGSLLPPMRGSVLFTTTGPWHQGHCQKDGCDNQHCKGNRWAAPRWVTTLEVTALMLTNPSLLLPRLFFNKEGQLQWDIPHHKSVTAWKGQPITFVCKGMLAERFLQLFSSAWCQASPFVWRTDTHKQFDTSSFAKTFKSILVSSSWWCASMLSRKC